MRTRRTKRKNGKEKSSIGAISVLVNNILAGCLVILFIGVCAFAILFLAMCLL